ncbi:MAG: hypothetical protein ABIN91_11090 [Mucilaginibacter sp.]|uniref:hypothetical protein n=1 Tax=Mucilaginibacter sp. TaxID=1882438 RepID=UPI0032638B21
MKTEYEIQKSIDTVNGSMQNTIETLTKQIAWVIVNQDNKIVGVYDSPEQTVSEHCDLNNWSYSEVNLTVGDFKPLQWNFNK